MRRAFLPLLFAVLAAPLLALPAAAQHNSWDPGCVKSETSNPCGNAEGLLHLETKSLPDRTAAAGTGARAWADNSTAYGHNARVSVDGPPGEGLGGTLRMSHDTLYDSTVLGQESYSWARHVTAVGADAGGQDSRATAIGNFARATALRATAVGQAARATGRYSLAFGQDAQASAEDATALGQATRASAARATALGRGAIVNAADATALGHQSRASAGSSLAVGDSANAYGAFATVLGQSATGGASGERAVTGTTAVGHSASATAVNAVAVGQSASVDADNSIAIGERASAEFGEFGNAANAIAIGAQIQLSSPNTTAFGYNANAGDANATALGHDSRATSVAALAVGNIANAYGGEATAAIGYGAQAYHTNAFALGAAARAGRANLMVLGTSASTYTLPGVASAASRTAQFGAVQLLTTDAAGNLAYTAPPAAPAPAETSQSAATVRAAAATVRTRAANQPADPATFAVRLVTIEATVGVDTTFIPFEGDTDSLVAVPTVAVPEAGSNDSPVLFATEAFAVDADVEQRPGPTTGRSNIAPPTQDPAAPPAGITSRAAADADTLRRHESQVQATAATAGANETDIPRNTLGIRENTAELDKAFDGIALALALDVPPLEAGRDIALSLGYGTYEDGHALALSGSLRVADGVFFSLGGGLGLETTSGGARAGVTFLLQPSR